MSDTHGDVGPNATDGGERVPNQTRYALHQLYGSEPMPGEEDSQASYQGPSAPVPPPAEPVPTPVPSSPQETNTTPVHDPPGSVPLTPVLPSPTESPSTFRTSSSRPEPSQPLPDHHSPLLDRSHEGQKLHLSQDKHRPVDVSIESSKLLNFGKTIRLNVHSDCTVVHAGGVLQLDVVVKNRTDYDIECLSCTLIMITSELDPSQPDPLSLENWKNSQLATNLLYATSKVMPSLSTSLDVDEEGPPIRTVHKMVHHKRMWDYHGFYQGGRFPQEGPSHYQGTLRYRLPEDDLPTTNQKNPEYFLRTWACKVTVHIRHRMNLSVEFPVIIEQATAPGRN